MISNNSRHAVLAAGLRLAPKACSSSSSALAHDHFLFSRVNNRSRGLASDGGKDRPLRMLKKANSINSGVALSRGVSIGQEEVELERKETLMHSLVVGDVHGSYRTLSNVNSWRKRPLFRRGDKNLTFKSGVEAAELLVDEVRRRDPYQTDFLQSVQDTSVDVARLFENAPKLAWVFKQLMEPERLITFRVPWTDDNGNARINRGYRIQYSSALGDFQGGLRFHPHLSHGSVRMLGWEQTLKNAVADVSFGGASGGSDFDPSNKSRAEVQRFSQAFMDQLYPFLTDETGDSIDILETGPGVGVHEVQALRNQFYQLQGEVEDATDSEEDLEFDERFGAGEVCPEGSGFGCVFFAERALDISLRTSLSGKRCLVSGADSLARSTAEMLIQKGAAPLTFSDESGFVVDEKGFILGDIEAIARVKSARGTLKDYARAQNKTFFDAGGNSLWEQVKGDLAFPCMFQGEINADDATLLADNGCVAVFENADRAVMPNAQLVLEERNILFAPSKAASSGAIITSSLMNSMIEEEDASFSTTDVYKALEESMERTHDHIYETAEKHGCAGNLKAGANLLSFIRIANSPMYRGSNDA